MKTRSKANQQTAQDKQEKLQQITAKLEEGVKEVFTSGKFTEYLSVMSRFHSYSINNQILIMLQHPSAQYVAGYKTWQKDFDRQVRKGEKAISILAPQTHKRMKEVTLEDGTTETQEVRYTTYRTVPVFADDQTEGKDLPTICNKLTASVDGYADLIARLESVSPVPVRYDQIDGGANGYFRQDTREIVVQADMSQSQTIKTLAHEIAHSILHDKENGTDKDADRATREVEAEGTAYTVLQYLGIDSADYSFEYVASWSSGREAKELRSTLDAIRTTAGKIIEGIGA